MWKDKKVLVTGSEGMIGKELVEQLEKLGAKVYGFDIKLDSIQNVKITRSCELVMERVKPEFVFHLFGIKGNPKMTNEQPIAFMVPMLYGDLNMITVAQEYGVKKFLYTSSIAVENPETDKFPAHAKLTGELLCEAMKIQYPEGTQYCIVRPANVYGKYDNFDNPNLMVITSLISKALSFETSLNVWGDGTQIRDFINAKDVARGMIKAMEEMPEKPVNLCSGEGVTIKRVAEIIAKETGKKIEWDTSKPRGADSRVMRLNWDFKPEIDIETGIKEIIQYLKCQKE